MTPIKVRDDEIIFDAVWNCRDNILYVSHQLNRSSSRYITHLSSAYRFSKQDLGSSKWEPNLFSSCSNEVIYVSGLKNIHRSVDNGETWSEIVQPTGNRSALSILIRPIDHYTEDLWLLEDILTKPFRVYTIDRRKTSRQPLTLRNVTIPNLTNNTTMYGKMALSTSTNTTFALESKRNILHVLSANNGQYVGQTEGDFGKVFNGNNTPSCLIFCTQRNDVMYVGHKTGLIVSVFKLVHEPL